MFALGKNIGYDFAGGVVAHKSNENFAEKRQDAWDMVRKRLTKEYPATAGSLKYRSSTSLMATTTSTTTVAEARTLLKDLSHGRNSARAILA